MKVLEVPIKVTPDGRLELPESVLNQLPTDQTVRAIILVSEPTDSEEQTAWACLTAEQFLRGYGEADGIYDRLEP
jgi:hypothetical protein